jgi:hypothetical protein
LKFNLKSSPIVNNNRCPSAAHTKSYYEAKSIASSFKIPGICLPCG